MTKIVYDEFKITLKNVYRSAQWAEKQVKCGQAIPIGKSKLLRSYDQTEWDCRTSCCMWGGASIDAGQGPAPEGPTIHWCAQSCMHNAVARLLGDCVTNPVEVIQLLRKYIEPKISLVSGPVILVIDYPDSKHTKRRKIIEIPTELKFTDDQLKVHLPNHTTSDEELELNNVSDLLYEGKLLGARLSGCDIDDINVYLRPTK